MIDSFDLYWDDISQARFKPLSRAEEQEMFREYRHGDREAAFKRILETNLRFVVRIAREYDGRLPMGDLVSCGNLGLIAAVERFDPSRGFKFITYAVWWIRQSILKEIGDCTGAVRRPYNYSADMSRARKAVDRLAQILDREPTTEEIYQVVPQARLLQVGHDVSLDAPVGEQPRSTMVGQWDLELDLDCGIVDDVLQALRPREQYIISRYYGLTGDEPQTLEQISEAMGVTRERVRQIKNVGLKKMRRNKKLAELV